MFKLAFKKLAGAAHPADAEMSKKRFWREKSDGDAATALLLLECVVHLEG